MPDTAKLSDFDYALPPERIAQVPAGRRDGARLFVHDVAGDATRHRGVVDLPDELAPGDLVVVNDTRVLPVRVLARRKSGGAVELLLLQALEPGRWRARVRPARKLEPGEELAVGEDALLRLEQRPEGLDGKPGPDWIVALPGPAGARAAEAAASWLERHGHMPLPPYIERRPGVADAAELELLDRERYQTVYARAAGAVAAPTAGLHFTPELLRALEQRGIERASVTLHVGAGTFEPVRTELLSEHRMHAESYELPEATVTAVERTRARGGRVVAVGTTTVRVLESVVRAEGKLVPKRGSTELFLVPGTRFEVVDTLLTNFHLPRSTLLMLVSAFAGRERILRLYAEAIELGYRFFSYGDAMLLDRSRPRGAGRSD